MPGNAKKAINTPRVVRTSLFITINSGRGQVCPQWGELPLIIFPLRHGGVVDPAPYLYRAGSSTWCRVPVKLRARVLPFEAAELQQSARLADLIRDQRFITH